MRRKDRKRTLAKQPYEGYTLPPSSEKGQPFVDFNKIILREEKPPKKVKTVKKRRA